MSALFYTIIITCCMGLVICETSLFSQSSLPQEFQQENATLGVQSTNETTIDVLKQQQLNNNQTMPGYNNTWDEFESDNDSSLEDYGESFGFVETKVIIPEIVIGNHPPAIVQNQFGNPPSTIDRDKIGVLNDTFLPFDTRRVALEALHLLPATFPPLGSPVVMKLNSDKLAPKGEHNESFFSNKTESIGKNLYVIALPVNQQVGDTQFSNYNEKLLLPPKQAPYFSNETEKLAKSLEILQNVLNEKRGAQDSMLQHEQLRNVTFGKTDIEALSISNTGSRNYNQFNYTPVKEAIGEIQNLTLRGSTSEVGQVHNLSQNIPKESIGESSQVFHQINSVPLTHILKPLVKEEIGQAGKVLEFRPKEKIAPPIQTSHQGKDPQLNNIHHIHQKEKIGQMKHTHLNINETNIGHLGHTRAFLPKDEIGQINQKLSGLNREKVGQLNHTQFWVREEIGRLNSKINRNKLEQLNEQIGQLNRTLLTSMKEEIGALHSTHIIIPTNKSVQLNHTIATLSNASIGQLKETQMTQSDKYISLLNETQSLGAKEIGPISETQPILTKVVIGQPLLPVLTKSEAKIGETSYTNFLLNNENVGHLMETQVTKSAKDIGLLNETLSPGKMDIGNLNDSQPILTKDIIGQPIPPISIKSNVTMGETYYTHFLLSNESMGQLIETQMTQSEKNTGRLNETQSLGAKKIGQTSETQPILTKEIIGQPISPILTKSKTNMGETSYTNIQFNTENVGQLKETQMTKSAMDIGLLNETLSPGNKDIGHLNDSQPILTRDIIGQLISPNSTKSYAKMGKTNYTHFPLNNKSVGQLKETQMIQSEKNIGILNETQSLGIKEVGHSNETRQIITQEVIGQQIPVLTKSNAKMGEASYTNFLLSNENVGHLMETQVTKPEKGMGLLNETQSLGIKEIGQINKTQPTLTKDIIGQPISLILTKSNAKMGETSYAHFPLNNESIGQSKETQMIQSEKNIGLFNQTQSLGIKEVGRSNETRQILTKEVIGQQILPVLTKSKAKMGETTYTDFLLNNESVGQLMETQATKSEKNIGLSNETQSLGTKEIGQLNKTQPILTKDIIGQSILPISTKSNAKLGETNYTHFLLNNESMGLLKESQMTQSETSIGLLNQTQSLGIKEVGRSNETRQILTKEVIGQPILPVLTKPEAKIGETSYTDFLLNNENVGQLMETQATKSEKNIGLSSETQSLGTKEIGQLNKTQPILTKDIISQPSLPISTKSNAKLGETNYTHFLLNNESMGQLKESQMTQSEKNIGLLNETQSLGTKEIGQFNETQSILTKEIIGQAMSPISTKSNAIMSGTNITDLVLKNEKIGQSNFSIPSLRNEKIGQINHRKFKSNSSEEIGRHNESISQKEIFISTNTVHQFLNVADGRITKSSPSLGLGPKQIGISPNVADSIPVEKFGAQKNIMDSLFREKIGAFQSTKHLMQEKEIGRVNHSFIVNLRVGQAHNTHSNLSFEVGSLKNVPQIFLPEKIGQTSSTILGQRMEHNNNRLNVTILTNPKNINNLKPLHISENNRSIGVPLQNSWSKKGIGQISTIPQALYREEIGDLSLLLPLYPQEKIAALAQLLPSLPREKIGSLAHLLIEMPESSQKIGRLIKTGIMSPADIRNPGLLTSSFIKEKFGDLSQILPILTHDKIGTLAQILAVPPEVKANAVKVFIVREHEENESSTIFPDDNSLIQKPEAALAYNVSSKERSVKAYDGASFQNETTLPQSSVTVKPTLRLTKKSTARWRVVKERIKKKKKKKKKVFKRITTLVPKKLKPKLRESKSLVKTSKLLKNKAYYHCVPKLHMTFPKNFWHRLNKLFTTQIQGKYRSQAQKKKSLDLILYILCVKNFNKPLAFSGNPKKNGLPKSSFELLSDGLKNIWDNAWSYITSE